MKGTSRQQGRREYYAKNRKRIIAKSAKYYLDNKQKVLARLHERHKEDPLPVRERVREWAKKNPDRIQKFQRTWRERHPEKRKLYTRNSRIRAYGISPETYYEMLEKQGHRCAICRKEAAKRAMGIDHEHKSGKVRGLLCDGCNLSLGHIEREGFLEKAKKYLAKYK